MRYVLHIGSSAKKHYTRLDWILLETHLDQTMHRGKQCRVSAGNVLLHNLMLIGCLPITWYFPLRATSRYGTSRYGYFPLWLLPVMATSRYGYFPLWLLPVASTFSSRYGHSVTVALKTVTCTEPYTVQGFWGDSVNELGN